MNQWTQPIGAVLVDDEANGRENLALLLKDFCPQVKVLGTAGTISEAKQLLEEKQPQLVFLDIQMGSHTIFELLNQLEGWSFEIIFVTAHDHFALRAFQFMAIDYLLKPIEIPLLIKSVDRACTNIKQRSLQLHIEELMQNMKSVQRDQHKIAFSTTEGYEMVYVRDISYCLADGSYTHVHLKDRPKLVVSKNLKHYERLLDGYGFLRTHQSCLVNLQYVQTIERTGGGAIRMEDGRSLPISKNRRLELETAIKHKRRLI